MVTECRASDGMGTGHGVVAIYAFDNRGTVASTLTRTIFIVALPYFGLLSAITGRSCSSRIHDDARRVQARCTLPDIKSCKPVIMSFRGPRRSTGRRLIFVSVVLRHQLRLRDHQ